MTNGEIEEKIELLERSIEKLDKKIERYEEMEDAYLMLAAHTKRSWLIDKRKALMIAKRYAKEN